MNPGEIDWQSFYQEGIDDRRDYIKFIHKENKTLQSIRENFQSEWKIVELCREIMYENAKKINQLMVWINDDRTEIKKLG